MYNFPPDYFKDEYREGFLVKSMVKRAWAAQIEVLGHIDRICQKYGLKYWAMWGTLLGAIRHDGYVPWDDDLDIAMKRADYDKLLQVAKDELPKGFVVMSPYTEPEWTEQIARINNGHTVDFSDDFLDSFHGCPYSTGVDIFPYDYIPDDVNQRREQSKSIALVVNVRRLVLERQSLINQGKYRGELERNISTELDKIEELFGFEFNRYLHLDNQLLCLYDQISASYGDETCKNMTCLGERAKRQSKGGDFIVPAYLLDEFVDHDFEGLSIKVPKYYEIVLSLCYGKQFMIPVKGGAAGHDYPFYKGQTEKLKEIGRYDEVMEAVERSDKRMEYAGISDFISNLSPCADDESSNEKEIINDTKKVYDSTVNNTEIANWCRNGKKTVMHCMSILDVFKNEEKAINKLERTLEFFREKKNEVQLVMLEASYVEEILEKKDIELKNRYRSVIDTYITEGWGYHILTENVKIASEYCDAYFGSANEYIRLFISKNKPVMIQNMEI